MAYYMHLEKKGTEIVTLGVLFTCPKESRVTLACSVIKEKRVPIWKRVPFVAIVAQGYCFSTLNLWVYVLRGGGVAVSALLLTHVYV